MSTKKPPSHLGADARKFWTEIVNTYELECHDYRRLEVACESWDCILACRKTIKREGLTYSDKFGNPRKHPAVAIMEQARISFLRSVREMGLDIVDSRIGSRPPRIGGQIY